MQWKTTSKRRVQGRKNRQQTTANEYLLWKEEGEGEGEGGGDSEKEKEKEKEKETPAREPSQHGCVCCSERRNTNSQPAKCEFVAGVGMYVFIFPTKWGFAYFH